MTPLCPPYARAGACSNGIECRFAHGEAELRPWVQGAKTKLCKYVQIGGKCQFGSRCRHAHSEIELTKLFVPALSGASADTGAPSADTGAAIPLSRTLDTEFENIPNRNVGFARLLENIDSGESDSVLDLDVVEAGQIAASKPRIKKKPKKKSEVDLFVR
jgi:hypothetical protein